MMAKGWGRYRWLDYRALLQRFMRDDQELIAVKYFTSRVTFDPERLTRQDNYLQALAKRGGVEIVTGEYASRKVQCQVCGAWYARRQEKKTDVNLATHLVADFYQNVFDRFLLICADADLVPAVEHVIAGGRPMMLVDPPRRHSTELASLAAPHLHVSASWLRQHQLPNPVEWVTGQGKTRRLHRPSSWA